MELASNRPRHSSVIQLYRRDTRCSEARRRVSLQTGVRAKRRECLVNDANGTLSEVWNEGGPEVERVRDLRSVVGANSGLRRVECPPSLGQHESQPNHPIW